MDRIGRRTVTKALEKIHYEKDLNQAKALLALAYLTHLPAKQLLNLKSTDISRKGSKIKIYTKNKIIKLNMKDPLMRIAWIHIEKIPPYYPLFYYFNNERNNGSYKRNDDSYYYYIKKWFYALNLDVTPKMLQ